MKAWNIGDSEKHSITITETANKIFADMSGDNNPVHFSKERMAKTHFKKPIANGIQCISCIGATIVKMFVSDSTIVIAIEQHNSFLKPVYVGETITATIEIESIPKPDNYWLQCMITNGDNEIVTSCRFRVRVLEA